MGSKSISLLVLSLSGFFFIGSVFNYFISAPIKQDRRELVEIKTALEVSLPDTALPVVALDEVHLAIDDPLEKLRWDFPDEAETLESGQTFVFEQKKEVEVEPARVLELPALQVELQQKRPKKFDKNFDWGRLAQVLSPTIAQKKKVVQKIPTEVKAEKVTQQNIAETRIRVASGGEIIVRGSSSQKKTHHKNHVEKSVLAAVDKSAASSSTNKTTHSAAPSGPATLTGHLEMTGGLGYSGSGEKILIYREVEGTFWDEGKIWLRQGQYEISVEDTQGILVAQLRDETGFLVGEGVFDLSQLSQNESELVAGQTLYKNINMKIRPVIKGITGKVVSAYSFADVNVPVEEPMVLSSVFDDLLPIDEEGDFFVEHVVQKSRFQLKATARDHWGTIVLAQAGVHQKVQLFPDKMIKAMIELSLGGNHPVVENYGIVWGRVLENGKPVVGAKVELIGEDLRPIYFQSMIPDPGLHSTSANGLFAFIGVSPGLQQVQAQLGDRWLKPVSFSADSRHVSNVVIEKAPTHRVPVRLFDAFETTRPLPGVVRVIGDENMYEVSSSGLGAIESPLDQQLMFVEATSFTDYESLRLLTTRSEKYIHLPMVTTGWIQSLAIEKGILANKDLGTVIGFSNGNSGFRTFEVFIGSDRRTEDHPVIYFDSSGRIVDRGVSGGGFIIFNIERGLQTIVLNPNAPYDVASKMVYSEPGVISLFQQTYR